MDKVKYADFNRLKTHSVYTYQNRMTALSDTQLKIFLTISKNKSDITT